MDDVSTHLREAVGEPPPTAIDLDRLIAAEQRRSRVRAWTAAGTGAVAALAAILAVPILLTGPAPGGEARPGGTPAVVDLCNPAASLPRSGDPVVLADTVRGRPTEPADKAMPRLTTALLRTLQARLPANVSVQNIAGPGCPPGFESQPDGTYKMGLHLARGEDMGNLYVIVGPTVADRVGCYANANWDNADCERVDLPDGTVVTTRTRNEPVAQVGTEVTRPDGTFVGFVDSHWSSQQPRPAPERILPAEQVITVGENPALTLYP